MLEDPWRHLVDAVGSKDRVPEFSVDTGNEQDLVISSNDMTDPSHLKSAKESTDANVDINWTIN
jgi:hypothetical protein